MKSTDVEAEVLGTTSTPPGVQLAPGRSYVVLLLPDGEVRYYLQSAVETTEWRPM